MSSVPVVVHGHFYQPPRENPWTGHVERQHSAEPDHDWNARVHRECYRPNAFARIFDEQGRIEAIGNTYAHMSFNFGPTLLAWMEVHRPAAYRRVLDADRASCDRHGGHGNAIAQSFHHSILPLCNERDRRTQVKWGLEDFRHRFGRDSESIWLPETACNDATLSILVEEGLRWVLLAPRQAGGFRPLEGGAWRSARDFDCGHPYRWNHPDGSGRSIAVFFYDGDLARAVAFGGALASSSILVDHFEKAAGRTDGFVHLATDGETYGHHDRFGDLTLAYSLAVEASRRGFEPINYGEALDRFEPVAEVRLAQGDDGLGSSWSCAHGVARWYRDCGCRTGGEAHWTQAWRSPLRDSLDHLRDHFAGEFEQMAGEFFRDPWQARDAYVQVRLDPRRRDSFLREQGRRPDRSFDSAGRRRALSLLELQHHAMLMYTSCGWFFNDLAGLETVQILRYAGRALDLSEALGISSPRAGFLERLAEARCNDPADGTGADLFRREVEPARVSLSRMAAHVSLTGLFGAEVCRPAHGALPASGVRADAPPSTGRFRVECREWRLAAQPEASLATGRFFLEEMWTGESGEVAIAAIHTSDLEVQGGMQRIERDQSGVEPRMAVVREAFADGSVERALVELRTQFAEVSFTEADLIAEGDDDLSRVAVAAVVGRFRQEYTRLYDSHRVLFQRLHAARLPLPPELRVVAESTLGQRFEAALESFRESGDPAAFEAGLEVARQAAEQEYSIQDMFPAWRFESVLEDAVVRCLEKADLRLAPLIVDLLDVFRDLGAEVDVRSVQEKVYAEWGAVFGRAGAQDPRLRSLMMRLGFSPCVLDGT